MCTFVHFIFVVAPYNDG